MTMRSQVASSVPAALVTPRTGSPVVRRQRLGLELRRLREAAGLTIEQVAERLECSDSKVSRIETGQVGATPRDVRDMLELYDVDAEQRKALVQHAREGRKRRWWDAFGDVPIVPAYVGLEVAAASIYTYEPLLVPGLLQTREYATAILQTLSLGAPLEQVERRVELRMARQSLLTKGTPALWAVIDEAALRRPVGGQAVMRAQLQRLLDAAALPGVTLQVLPFGVGQHAGMDGAFTVLRFPESADPDLVYLEHTDNDLYLERAEDVSRFILVFEQLRSVALNPEESATFVAALCKD